MKANTFKLRKEGGRKGSKVWVSGGIGASAPAQDCSHLPLWLSETKKLLLVPMSVGWVFFTLNGLLANKYSLQPRAADPVTRNCNTYLSII